MRLLILGGGVAGLDVASNLKRAFANGAFEVGLVDREPAHVWKPRLHTIASGTTEAIVQQTSYVAQAVARDFAFHPGAVREIDRHAKRVGVDPVVLDGEEVVPARWIPYDVLLLALGSRTHDFGTPGVAEHCATLDSRSEAVAFNDRVRARLMRAATSDGTVTVGIVGGGATGVELAAELVQFAATAGGFGFPRASSALRIVLLNADDRLLKAFPEEVSRATERRLVQLGVDVRAAAKVAAADACGFVLEGGERVDADLRVWAAGIRAPAVLDTLADLERGRGGQLVVDERLVCPQDPSVLAIGDCANVRSHAVPATAQAAFQQAVYLVTNLAAIVQGRTVPPFRYRDFGSLVSLGSFTAYGSLGKFGFFEGGFIEGRVAQLGHALLYRRHQARLYGVGRGSLLWLCDAIASRIKPFARLT